MLKTIDFDNSLVTDITLTSLAQYRTTRNSITTFGMDNYYLGDYFLVIRSSTLKL